ncbi:hypothetical protein [Mangrovibacterium sp.]|uniref:hypothetical protein n=1 Tax=Mangrovibacterium sp. TaxID=1961364 RepID=UPI003563E674
MKNRKLINIFLVVAAIAISAIIGRDFINNRKGKSVKNPYELNLGEYAKVDSSEILYQETKAIQLKADECHALAISHDTLFVAVDSSLVFVATSGQILKVLPLPAVATAIAIDQSIWLAFNNRVMEFSKNGDQKQAWPEMGPRSVLTSLAVDDNFVFVADAGNRLILQFARDGKLINKLGERDEQKGIDGFTIPSPHFDLDLSEDGFLWAVNPGEHSLINFNADGSFRTSWSSSSANTEGFSGCCNPVHISMAAEDKFITSEKGIVRVKVYDQHGSYLGVVAAPDQFDEDSPAPDVCVDAEGRVVLLDFSRNQIRFFELKKQDK